MNFDTEHVDKDRRLTPLRWLFQSAGAQRGNVSGGHMRALGGALAAIVILCGGGCGIARTMSISQSRANLAKLEIGMTKDQVIAVMGEPRSREAYPNVEFLMYQTELEDVYQRTDERITPVAFVNGRVVGWGRNYYEEKAKTSRIEGDVTVRNR